MQKLWRLVGVCSVAAVLAACGGGDDPDGDVDTGDTTTVSGSFARCEAMTDGPVGSTLTTITFGTTGIAPSQRVYAASSSCGGLLVAVVDFPTIALADAGTVTVSAPNSGTTTARRGIFTSALADVTATVASDVVANVVNGELIIQDPNSSLVLYRVTLRQEAASDKDLMIRYNNRLYFGGDVLGADGYPTSIDYNIAWTPV